MSQVAALRSFFVFAFLSLSIPLGASTNHLEASASTGQWQGGIYFNSGWFGTYFQMAGINPMVTLIGFSIIISHSTRRFGSISYSPSTDTFGWSYSENNRYGAKQSSYRYCGQYDCQEIVWVQGGCAAVASGPGGANLSWGITLIAGTHSVLLLINVKYTPDLTAPVRSEPGFVHIKPDSSRGPFFKLGVSWKL